MILDIDLSVKVLNVKIITSYFTQDLTALWGDVFTGNLFHPRFFRNWCHVGVLVMVLSVQFFFYYYYFILFLCIFLSRDDDNPRRVN